MRYGSQINNYENIGVGSTDVQAEQKFISKVFSIMTMGLFLTAGVSLVTLYIPSLLKFVLSSYLFLGIGELILVIVLVRKITTMSPDVALGWFLFYSALNGLTLSPIFLIYTKSSITSAFFISGAMFGFMAIWGVTTKKNLTSLGSLAFMGLIGIVIASIVNIFVASSGFQMIISYIAVAVFIGLTAYDAQKLKYLANASEGRGGLAVLGALQLYLDFINLFIHILYIIGIRRD